MLFIRTAITLLYYALDGLLQTLRPCTELCPDKRALIVRIDHIGDFVLWRNSAQVLIDSLHSQGYQVTLVANSAWADLAKTSLPIDKVVPINRRSYGESISYRSSVNSKLSGANFELAINPVFSRDLRGGDSLIRASRARERVGCSGDLSNLNLLEKMFADRIYTQLIEIPGSALHEIEKSSQFLAALDICTSPDLRPSIEANPLPENLILPERYVVLAPGASWEGKKWPLDRFKKLSEWLSKKYGLTPVAVGSDADIESGKLILGEDGLNLCGKTTLAELQTIIAGAKLVISNDSGPIHCAFAAGVNSICILGGGHFGRFMPYPQGVDDGKPVPVAIYADMSCFDCGWRCRYPRKANQPVRCVENITLEMVKNEVIHQLGERP